MTIVINKVHNELVALAAGNDEYAVFNRRIVNTSKTMLGVRVPAMRKLARPLAKNCSHQDIAQYMSGLDKTIYEQVFLAGLIINYAKIGDNKAIDLSKQYLALVDSWAEVDIFATKRKKFDEKLWWDFAVSCLGSEHEFTVRYGVIEMMANYLNEKYIEQIYKKLRSIKHDGYYVRMGMAWLYATAAIDFYKQTLREIEQSSIAPWTKAKALTKMLESYQFTPEQKSEIRDLRSKLALSQSR